MANYPRSLDEITSYGQTEPYEIGQGLPTGYTAGPCKPATKEPSPPLSRGERELIEGLDQLQSQTFWERFPKFGFGPAFAHATGITRGGQWPPASAFRPKYTLSH